MKTETEKRVTRRDVLRSAGILAGATFLAGLTGPEKSFGQETGKSSKDEEYVLLSANANLPLFVAHDHPALKLIGEVLCVKVTIAGPNSVRRGRAVPNHGFIHPSILPSISHRFCSRIASKNFHECAMLL
jgi:hypothetical protein